MPKSTIIKELWDDFEKGCIPLEAPEIQRIEMKKAFFAGAFGFFKAQLIILEAVNDDEDLAAAKIEEVSQEILAFSQEFVLETVKHGKKLAYTPEELNKFYKP